ncbi:SRPBCC family protein [Lentzea sp. E54]|uniref:SRPBCC family protein n=1 Tax=Lentzea xerophila TaxID=3435883 RepID=UPI003DA6085C
MPADADTVFDVVSDLENLTSWLPGAVEIELSSPRQIRLWLPRRHGDLDLERRVEIDWDRLRISWGAESTTSCSGRLQVLRLSQDRSAVTVQLTGLPYVRASRVHSWVDEALDALVAVVLMERRARRQVIHTLSRHDVVH